MDTAKALIDHFEMTVLPAEGGIFKQTYKAAQTLPGGKPMSTAILYLLTAEEDSFSAMHRLPTDEVFHFYRGGAVEMLLLYPGGEVRTMRLGADVLNGEQVQFVVPAGVWQGCRLADDAGADYALLGTTMAPGFMPEDYEGGERDALTAAYPSAAAMIARLTRADAPLHMDE